MRTCRVPYMMWIALALTITAPAGAADYVQLSGKELYVTLCASCHGPVGRGDGRVAKTLPGEVPDLSLIARRHGGVYPRDLVEKIIDGRYVLAGHGSRTMPVWGEDLSRAAVGDPDAQRAIRIVTGRLADYLWSLQRPAASADVPVTADTDKAPKNSDNSAGEKR